jgi:hypothetical protein
MTTEVGWIIYLVFNFVYALWKADSVLRVMQREERNRLCSNAHRGKRRKIEEKANPFLTDEKEEPFVPSKGWAELIKPELFLAVLREESVSSLLVWSVRRNGDNI